MPEPTYSGPTNVLYFRSTDSLEKILKENKKDTWIICFYTVWNPLCANFAPIFSQLSVEYVQLKKKYNYTIFYFNFLKINKYNYDLYKKKIVTINLIHLYYIIYKDKFLVLIIPNCIINYNSL